MSNGKGEVVQVTANEVRVRVKHFAGGGFSWRGKMFEPEADGIVLCPPEATDDAASMGFYPVDADGNYVKVEKVKSPAELELDRINGLREKITSDADKLKAEREEFEREKAEFEAAKKRK
jgi:hypothetical protein